MATEIDLTERTIDHAQIRDRLVRHRVPPALADRAAEFLPDEAVGVALYGSFARGDEGAESDVDLVVVTDRRLQPPADPGVSINSYSPNELLEAAGSLFAFHLRRDGVAIHGAHAVEALLAGAHAPDPYSLLNRIRHLSAVVGVRDADVESHLHGLVRVTKYLLRSAMYAEAIKDGKPSFSVAELAERAAEPGLVALLSSHPSVAPAPSIELLRELTRRLAGLLGPLPEPPRGTLEAIAVTAWSKDRDLARLAILAMGDGSDVPYDLLGRVVL